MIIIDQSVPIISAYVPPEAVQDIMGTMFFTLALLLTDVLLRIAIERHLTKNIPFGISLPHFYGMDGGNYPQVTEKRKDF